MLVVTEEVGGVRQTPVGERARLESGCDDQGPARVHLVAPTTPTERVRAVSDRSEGFVYLVSITGVTGARQRLSPDLKGFVERVRGVTDKPLAVGFGISGPEQAAEVAAVADGVIVGSALLRRAAQADGIEQVRGFVADLRQAGQRI